MRCISQHSNCCLDTFHRHHNKTQKQIKTAFKLIWFRYSQSVYSIKHQITVCKYVDLISTIHAWYSCKTWISNLFMKFFQELFYLFSKLLSKMIQQNLKVSLVQQKLCVCRAWQCESLKKKINQFHILSPCIWCDAKCSW